MIPGSAAFEKDSIAMKTNRIIRFGFILKIF